MTEPTRPRRAAPRALAIAATVAVALTLLSPAADAKKVWSNTPKKGFIDDAMAFDPAGRRLAFIHTDSATFLNIIVLDTSSKKKKLTIKIDQPRRVPRRLAFTPDGSKIVFLWVDGYKGNHAAMLFDASTGKTLKQSKPGQSSRLLAHKGKQVLAMHNKKTDARGELHEIAYYRTSDFRRVARGSLRIGKDGRLKKPRIRVIYWDPGHTSVVGLIPGRYDPKRDMRLPTRAVRYSLLKRRTSWNYTPRKLMAWTRAINIRPKYSEQYRFVKVSDDLKKLYYVNRKNDLQQLKLPVAWNLYEHKSLVQRETYDGKTLYFSMTIDPVNPVAVARKKADKERCDLYLVNDDGTVAKVGRVLTKKRKFSWIVGASHFAYLRKLKGFGRGGKTLELHAR